MEEKDTLLEVENLCVHYQVEAEFLGRKASVVKAVDGVSFKIKRGATVGLVGESGSGKTTVGRALIHLAPVTSGSVRFDGLPISSMTPEQFFPLRKRFQMIFQDPFNSLDPRMTIEQIIAEPLDIHFSGMSQGDKRKRVSNLLEKVGLSPEHARRYPHEFSGGQRQRIGIARALAVEPEFIICDEPVSALDVSVQAQVVNLLQDLQAELNLTYLFIAHDLAVVEHISDEVLVMTEGRIVEHASSDEIYANPQHEYTIKLLSAVPAL